MKNPRLAAIFITAMALGGLATLTTGTLKMTALHPYQFLCLLLLGALTSRTKVKLPGVDSNMSVNLPFLLIAAMQLSLLESVTVALVSAGLQSLPKAGGQLHPMKVLFNTSTMVVASGAAAALFHSDRLNAMHYPSTLVLAASCVLFFCVNTLPVATIISITEGGRLSSVWSSIVHLSFPYFVACTGLTSMVTTASQHVGWQGPLAVLPAMLLMYRSYQTYFGPAGASSSNATAKALTAAAR